MDGDDDEGIDDNDDEECKYLDQSGFKKDPSSDPAMRTTTSTIYSSTKTATITTHLPLQKFSISNSQKSINKRSRHQDRNQPKFCLQKVQICV